MIIDASYGSPDVKPPLWAINPGMVADNAARMGLPMPVGLWWMPEGGGNRTFDYSGNGHDGELTGGISWTPGGLLNGGVDGYINLFDPPALNSMTEITYVFGIKVNTWATNVRIVFKSWDHYVRLRAIGGNGIVFFKDYSITAANQNFISPKFTTGIVHHCALTYSEATDRKIRGYLNGNLLGVSAASEGTLKDDTANFEICGSASSAFDGICYYFYIFSAALTPTQVQIFSADPFGLVRPIPWQEWAYVAAPVGAPLFIPEQLGFQPLTGIH